MSPMILYHYPSSPNSRGVLVTARSLGIDLEIKEVDLGKGEHRQPWFLAINPLHAVPALDDNGHVLTESRAISMYLANTKGPKNSMYPFCPKKRSIVDMRLFFDAGTTFGRLSKIINTCLSGGTEISDEQIASIYECFGWLNGFLSGNKWLAGDKVTIADTVSLATLSTCFGLGAKLDDYPELQRWYEQCKEFPGFEENDKAVTGYCNFLLRNVTKGF